MAHKYRSLQEYREFKLQASSSESEAAAIEQFGEFIDPQPLGEGQFGIVFKDKLDGEYRAIKVIVRSNYEFSLEIRNLQ